MGKRRRIVIVGGSIAGVYSALLLREKHQDADILILEKNDKLLKKIYATGNGHCNLLNLASTGKNYNRPDFIDSAFSRHPVSSLLSFLGKHGIATRAKGDLVYPESYSAASFCLYLEMLIKKMGIEVRLNTRIVDYDGSFVYGEGGEKYPYDHILFCFGGKSQSRLGSDGSLFPLLIDHGYSLLPLRPGLCPIKTKQRHPRLKGVRREAAVKAEAPGGLTFLEKGEVLFKDDGLSGIVIFDLASFLARSGANAARIHLDLLPSYSCEEAVNLLKTASAANQRGMLLCLFEKPLAEYIASLAENAQNPIELIRISKDLRFDFESLYPFSDSQVTVGGIDLGQLDGNLKSLAEPNVSFAGECLDVDGDCGGYNLTWCLLSAFLAAEGI